MENKKLLADYTDLEKGAYLGAIASIATADSSASEAELQFLNELCDAAEVGDEQRAGVMRAAKELSGEELNKCLDILKESDLRFSLLTDLISFAEADNELSPEEKANIDRISAYLGISREQFSLLDHFVKRTNEEVRQGAAPDKPGFLESLGIGDKLKASGINLSSLAAGVLGFAAPMLLSRMFSGGQYRSSGIGRMAGGIAGTGLGSIIAGLSGGRGLGSTGGILSKLFGNRL